MAKRVAILQSNYIPWKGYFDIIGSVDEFIIYDEVQYTKNDWRNRNKIKTPQGVQWLTIPVYQMSLGQKISETKVSNVKWASKHWQSLQTNYSKAAFFREDKPFFEHYYRNVRTPFLSEINEGLLMMICELIGIKTRISKSADYVLTGDPTERLVSLCKQTNAELYLSGPSAKNYLQEGLFEEEGIKVEWADYHNYPQYSQLFPPFEHAVSILDLIFNVGGSNALKYLKCNRR
jgi:hypothetical protein